MKCKLPSRLFFDNGEIQEARAIYIDKHWAFFGPDGVAQSFNEEASADAVKLAWKRTLSPPEFVTDSWALIMIWAFWCTWSEYTMPMLLAMTALGLYSTGWFYYEFISPLLRLFLN